MNQREKSDSSPGRAKPNGDTSGQSPRATFLRLSCVLTGKDTLDAELSAAYYERTREKLTTKLDALFDRFNQAIAKGMDPVRVVAQILPDPTDGSSAKLILLLWYTGAILTADGDWEIRSADQYYRALIWEAIGAHPPTLSNGYYGHWKYPPEYEV